MNMHPLFQQKLEVYEALRARSAAARAEARSKCRFYVEPHGEGWGVVSVATKRLHGKCTRHREAVQYAERLERAVEKRDSLVISVKDVAESMTRWVSLLGLAMFVWTMWGVG